MNSRETAPYGIVLTTRRATSTRWLLLSMAAVLAISVLALPSALEAADDAGKQLKFGTDMARRGLWSEALFRFRQADRLDPGNAHILNNMAVSYEALGLFDKALETYQAALKAGPDDRELRTNYASFVEFYQNFRPREAENQADEAGEPETTGGSE
jgi:tetratricopeptide (TPR) repeat protein